MAKIKVSLTEKGDTFTSLDQLEEHEEHADWDSGAGEHLESAVRGDRTCADWDDHEFVVVFPARPWRHRPIERCRKCGLTIGWDS